MHHEEDLYVGSGALALMLAFAALAGCSGDGGTASAPGKPPASEQSGNAGTDNGSGGTKAGNGGNTGTKAGQPGSNAGTGTDSGIKAQTNAGANGGVNVGTVNEGTNAGTANEGKPKVVASNEAFRIYGPSPDSVVGKTFTVKGQARVFEAAFGYSFEDGHNVLAEGHAMADMGAPEWGTFELTVTLKEMPTSPTGVLTIFESSAKDGSPVHELHIAYKFEKGLLQLDSE